MSQPHHLLLACFKVSAPCSFHGQERKAWRTLFEGGTGTQAVLPTAPNRAAGHGEEQAWEDTPGATPEQQAVQDTGCSPVLGAWGAEPPLRSLTLSAHCRGCSCPRAFIRNQVWEILWLQGFCLVLRFEISPKLFSFTVLLGPSVPKWTFGVQNSRIASRARRSSEQGTTSITSVSRWWILWKLRGNAGIFLQCYLEAFKNSSLCTYCWSAVFKQCF